jgi:hypothetical protein
LFFLFLLLFRAGLVYTAKECAANHDERFFDASKLRERCRGVGSENGRRRRGWDEGVVAEDWAADVGTEDEDASVTAIAHDGVSGTSSVAGGPV